MTPDFACREKLLLSLIPRMTKRVSGFRGRSGFVLEKKKSRWSAEKKEKEETIKKYRGFFKIQKDIKYKTAIIVNLEWKRIDFYTSKRKQISRFFFSNLVINNL